MARSSVVVVLLALATACAAEETPPPEDVAHYSPDWPGGGEALLTGQLERIDGCVYVVAPGSDEKTIPVFSDDPAISWDGESLLAASRAMPLGEQVDLGGGGGSRGIKGVSVPDACDPDAPLFIVSS